jgi:hypothetical protein
MKNYKLEKLEINKMEEKELELRMYFFVPYNISSIQRAIQAGHSALEYADKYGSEEQYIRFIRKWKTWIILDGGTTNTHRGLDGIVMGTLDQIGDALLENNIKFAYFQEPDLNDALTAVCFLADERVWNYEDYPDFLNWILKNYLYDEPAQRIIELRMTGMLELIWMFPDYHKEWIKFLGGEKNVFLRELIRGKKLA